MLVKVTATATKNDCKTGGKWAHLDWGAALDKEIQQVFVDYGTVEAPMPASRARTEQGKSHKLEGFFPIKSCSDENAATEPALLPHERRCLAVL